MTQSFLWVKHVTKSCSRKNLKSMIWDCFNCFNTQPRRNPQSNGNYTCKTSLSLKLIGWLFVSTWNGCEHSSFDCRSNIQQPNDTSWLTELLKLAMSSSSSASSFIFCVVFIFVILHNIIISQLHHWLIVVDCLTMASSFWWWWCGDDGDDVLSTKRIGTWSPGVRRVRRTGLKSRPGCSSIWNCWMIYTTTRKQQHVLMINRQQTTSKRLKIRKLGRNGQTISLYSTLRISQSTTW